LFVGVELDARVAEEAAALIRELRQRVNHVAPRARITWVARERLHLTVRFIGNADEDHARDIQLALAPPIDVPPFDLTVTGVGAFPRGGDPRVLWAGLTRGRDALERLEREVTKRLEAVRIAPEERAYNPHLTLARVREAARLRSSTLFEGLRDAELGITRVEAITLFESRQSPKGSTYVPLQRTPLAGVT
jgi:2'-5' RNA ligase